ncbi:ribbon-helix-helix domain-containing protein [Nisaea nitritireducens]|uniref:ribbon-helix-helix domain-containing protein n=1 Tax=Nisaea nitritireducens TaxID=568392 RepID=UPI00186929AA
MAKKNRSSLVRRHFRLRGPHGDELRRSIALEPGFWSALDEMAPGDKLRELIESCLAGLTPDESLVSILRCAVLNHYRALCDQRRSGMKLSKPEGKTVKQIGARN